MPPYECDICLQQFSRPSSLSRHKINLHGQERIKYQCWSCTKIYARKENVIKHSKTEHNDTEQKFVIIRTTNERYNSTISAPETWTPPPEARLRSNGTIYKVKVRSQTPTPPQEWEPLSITQLCLRYPLPYPSSKEELLGELYISPSPSDSSILQE